MPSAVDVKIERNVWTDLTVAAGLSAGDDLLVQNIGNHSIRVEVADTIPSGDTVGLVLNPNKSAQALTKVSEKIWGFGRRSDSTAHLEAL